MRTIIWVIVLTLSSLATPGWAVTILKWDRNAETDMKEYNVYACLTPGCVVAQTAAMKQAPAITQVAVGVVPQWTLPLNAEGTVAVSAINTMLNESGLSVAIPFKTKPPAVPANPVVQ